MPGEGEVMIPEDIYAMLTDIKVSIASLTESVKGTNVANELQMSILKQEIAEVKQELDKHKQEHLDEEKHTKRKIKDRIIDLILSGTIVAVVFGALLKFIQGGN